MKAQTTRLGLQIIKEAASWVTPESLCVETSANAGYCIDKIFNYFYQGDTKNGEAYCAIFGWSVVDMAFKALGANNTLPKTAGALDLLNRSKKAGIKVDQVPLPGSVFYRKSSAEGATGHIGIFIKADDNIFHTIEGNTSFSFEGKKYEGVWMMNYPYSDIGKRGFQFIHIEKALGNDLIEFDYEDALSNNSNGLLIATALLGVGALGYYFLKNKRGRK